MHVDLLSLAKSLLPFLKRFDFATFYTIKLFSLVA